MTYEPLTLRKLQWWGRLSRMRDHRSCPSFLVRLIDWLRYEYFYPYD